MLTMRTSPKKKKNSTDSGFNDEVLEGAACPLYGGAHTSRTDYRLCRDCRTIGELRCRDCMVMFCVEHADRHHANKATSGHLIENRQERSKGALSCVDHEDMVCTAFCDTCQRLICELCDCGPNRTHHLRSISSAASDQRSSLEHLVTTTRSLALEELVSSSQKVASTKGQVLDDSETLQQKIKTFYEQQMDVLRQEQTMLLDQVGALTNYNLDAITKQRNSLQAVLTSTTSSLEFTRCALSLSCDAEILAMHGHLSSRLYSACNTSAQASRMDIDVKPLPEFKVNLDAVIQIQRILLAKGLSTLESPEEEDGADDPATKPQTSGPDIRKATVADENVDQLQEGEDRSASYPAAATSPKHKDSTSIAFLRTLSQGPTPAQQAWDARVK